MEKKFQMLRILCPFNREVERHIDKQYEKHFFELAHPNDEVIIDKDGAADAKERRNLF